MKRVEIIITGIVQGIGFRPYIYHLAQKHMIRGRVFNNEKGVFIDAEGEDEYLTQFIQEIPEFAPPLARIESILIKYLEPFGYNSFEIRKSEEAQEIFTLISFLTQRITE